MGIRISEMEEATTFGADDYVPIVTSGTNKKALGSKIKDFIAGFFVSKSGDTMSGDLTVEKSNGDFVSKNPNVTINTTANNGVTSSQIEGVIIKDSADNNVARCVSVQETTGDVIAQIAAFNKKTDGTATNNYINITIKKDGTKSYTVSDPAAFRNALDIGNIHYWYIIGNQTIETLGNLIKAKTEVGMYWGLCYLTSPVSGWAFVRAINRVIANDYAEIYIQTGDTVISAYTVNLTATTPTWTVKKTTLT